MKKVFAVLVILSMLFVNIVYAQSPLPTPTIPRCAEGQSGPDCAPWRPTPVFSPLPTPGSVAIAQPPQPAQPQPEQPQPIQSQPTVPPVILLPATGIDTLTGYLLGAILAASIFFICFSIREEKHGNNND